MLSFFLWSCWKCQGLGWETENWWPPVCDLHTNGLCPSLRSLKTLSLHSCVQSVGLRHGPTLGRQSSSYVDTELRTLMSKYITAHGSCAQIRTLELTTAASAGPKPVFPFLVKETALLDASLFLLCYLNSINNPHLRHR